MAIGTPQSAFVSYGPTVKFVTGVTASAAYRLKDWNGDISNAPQVRVRVSGAAEVSFTWDVVESAAIANAVWPDIIGKKCMTMGPTQTEVFTFDIRQYFAAVSQTPSSIEFTPGEGL